MKEEFKKIKAKKAVYKEPENQERPTIAVIDDGVLADLPDSIRKYLENQVDKAVNLMKQNKQTQEDVESIDNLMGETAQGLIDSMEDFITSGTGFEMEQPKEEEKQEQEQAETPPKTPKTPQEQQENQEMGNSSCTPAERAFLDSFIELQNAGKMLGMVRTGEPIQGYLFSNVLFIPRVDELMQSDKVLNSEFAGKYADVFGLVELKTQEVVENLRVLYREKDREENNKF